MSRMAAISILPCEAGEGDRRRRWRGRHFQTKKAGRTRPFSSARPAEQNDPIASDDYIAGKIAMSRMSPSAPVISATISVAPVSRSTV